MTKIAHKTAESRQKGIEQQITYVELNKLRDDTMESRYKTIKKENQIKKEKQLGTIDTTAIANEVNASPLNYIGVITESTSGNVHANEFTDIATICKDKSRSNNVINDSQEEKDRKFKIQLKNKLKRYHSFPNFVI